LASFSWAREYKASLALLAKSNDILEDDIIHWDTPIAVRSFDSDHENAHEAQILGVFGEHGREHA
jgi:hypothetical protein